VALELVATARSEVTSVADRTTNALDRGALTIGVGENDVATDAAHGDSARAELAHPNVAAHAANLGLFL
jgi:hypothetical protein